MPDGVNLSRRSLFRGRLTSNEPRVQLPWSVAWSDFAADCTRCGDCLTACPEQILVKGDGGFPSVDFLRGECTFAGNVSPLAKCRYFARPRRHPGNTSPILKPTVWPMARYFASAARTVASPGRSVSPHAGPGADPSIDAAACTGCGACVMDCPVGSIRVGAPAGEESR